MEDLTKRHTPTVKAIISEMNRREWSAQKLAEESGLAFQIVYRIITGESIPRADTLEKLAKGLNKRICLKA